MRDLDTRHMRSRVKGRPNIEQALRRLYLRVHKFGTLRAAPGSPDFRWALHVCTQLQAAIGVEAKGEGQ